jgi:hypothetical protein
MPYSGGCALPELVSRLSAVFHLFQKHAMVDRHLRPKVDPG